MSSKEEIGNKHGLMMHDPIQKYHIGGAMDEFAKEIALGFGKYLLSTKADLDLTTEQLFDKFIQSLNQ